jgi:hypothetical protein
MESRFTAFDFHDERPVFPARLFGAALAAIRFQQFNQQLLRGEHPGDSAAAMSAMTKPT